MKKKNEQQLLCMKKKKTIKTITKNLYFSII